MKLADTVKDTHIYPLEIQRKQMKQKSLFKKFWENVQNLKKIQTTYSNNFLNDEKKVLVWKEAKIDKKKDDCWDDTRERFSVKLLFEKV